MNSFGRVFRISIWGESHGPGVGVVIDGCPAGLPLGPQDFQADFDRRRGGQFGGTPRVEADLPVFQAGLFEGRTTGAPLVIFLENSNLRRADYERIKDLARPGHADLVARHRFGGFNDYRGGGHFSGRLTAPLVAAGVVAKKLLRKIEFNARLLEAGGSKEIEHAISAAQESGDSIGGLIECRITGLPSGLGEPFFDSIESQLAHLLFSIPAVKGVEFGAGFESAAMRGSECNDAIIDCGGATETNNAGGISGGLSNGNDLLFRVAVKPPSSIKIEQRSVNMRTGESAGVSVEGRHDVCIAVRAVVVVEAVAAIVLADFGALRGMVPAVFEANVI